MDLDDSSSPDEKEFPGLYERNASKQKKTKEDENESNSSLEKNPAKKLSSQKDKKDKKDRTSYSGSYKIIKKEWSYLTKFIHSSGWWKRWRWSGSQTVQKPIQVQEAIEDLQVPFCKERQRKAREKSRTARLDRRCQGKKGERRPQGWEEEIQKR